MAVRSITDPTINKISLAEYNAKVASGAITDDMIVDQVWIDTALTVPVQNKLVNIEANAQVNKIEDVKVNGTSLAITDKAVNVVVPTKTSEIANDSGFITADDIPEVTETDPTVPAWAKAASKPSYTYDEISGKPTLATVATSGSYNDLSNKPTLFSGSYNDLTDKPTIPSVDGLASETYVQNAVSDKATTTYVDNKVADLVNSAPTTLDTLGEVATAIQNNATVVEALNNAIGNKADKTELFSGSYNDLTDKPTLSTCTLKIWE